jgi:hypothetical protein
VQPTYLLRVKIHSGSLVAVRPAGADVAATTTYDSKGIASPLVQDPYTRNGHEVEVCEIVEIRSTFRGYMLPDMLCWETRVIVLLLKMKFERFDRRMSGVVHQADKESRGNMLDDPQSPQDRALRKPVDIR